VCIGRQTAKAAESAGFAHVVTATTATEDDMVAALLRVVNHGKPKAM
jgi:uroporphyrinogen-III synthase